jgi:hypothetical protein
MHEERRQSVSLSNDLLLQILDQQKADSGVLHELKGDINNRVKNLENAQNHNWWATYVITPFLMVAHATARHLGAKI